MIDRRYAINVAYRRQPFFIEVLDTGRKISSVVPNVEVVFGGPDTADPDMQIAELEALIARNVNGIILFPADPQKLTSTVDKAITKGIPVVTLFNDVKDSKRLTLVGGPEVASGKYLAERLLKDHPRLKEQNTKVLMSLNKPGETSTDQRCAGIQEALQNFPNIHVVATVYDAGDSNIAADVIEPVMRAEKDITVIFGLNARSAIGAISALNRITKTNGEPYQPGDVLLTGWDSDDDVIDNIECGWIHSTSVLHSSLCTQIAFNILDATNLGYLYPETLQLRELKFPAVPSEILIPEILVDRTNVEGFRRKQLIQSLRA